MRSGEHFPVHGGQRHIDRRSSAFDRVWVCSGRPIRIVEEWSEAGEGWARWLLMIQENGTCSVE